MASEALGAHPSRVPGSLVLALTGAALFAFAWELIGRTEALGPGWPPLSGVLDQFLDGATRSLLIRSTRVTVGEATLGLAVGVGAALFSSVVTVFFPHMRLGILHLGAILQAVPAIALGPLLMSVFPRPVTPIVLASLAVYFTMLVSATTGFTSTRPAHDDLFRVLGAGTRDRFLRLQLPHAVPVLVDGLKFAAPTAILGAIIGEWFGTDRGLGPIIVGAMQNFRMTLLWSTAISGAVISMIAYWFLAGVAHVASNRYR